MRNVDSLWTFAKRKGLSIAAKPLKFLVGRE